MPGSDSDHWTQESLAEPLSRIGEIVFAVRSIVPEHWYANFGYFSPDENHKCYGREGRPCKLNLSTGRLTVLVDDPEGAVRAPCVHYDGRRIVFSYRKGGHETHHLHEIRADGTGQTVFYGNLHPGDVYIDARPIPGTDRVVLIRSRSVREGLVARTPPADPAEPRTRPHPASESRSADG